VFPIAAVDSVGILAAMGTLIAAVGGSIAAFLKARSQGDSEETKSVIEVNEDLRRELKRRKEDSHDLRNENQELHAEIELQRGEITTQRDEINSLQERVASLRRQIEQLDYDLQRAMRTSGNK
jgi:chromosome segregation ATPase